MDFIHKVRSFQELNVSELYELLRLRSEVFVVEQNCVFLDMDYKDQQCYHVLLFCEGKLAAYSRLVPPGLSYKEVSIGRVISSPAFRGMGMGKKIMELSIQECQEIFGKKDVRIGAQVYATKFYTSLGFVAEGDPYDEDGIAHIEMVRKANAY